MSKENKINNVGTNGASMEIYSNSVNFAFSIYDVTLSFGLSNVEPNDYHNLVNIKMSPQHAKVMSLLLQKNIEKYEHDIGEIVLPEDLLSNLLKDKEND